MRFFDNKNNLTLVLSFAIFIFVILLSYFLYPLNKNFQDGYYALREKISGKKQDKNIVVVEIDEKTLKSLGRFPFDRDEYIPVIENLNKAGASVIGLDIIFPDSSNTLDDLRLSKAIKKAGNIILGYSLNEKASSRLELKVEKPIKILDEAKFNAGLINPLVDAKTQKVYSARPFNNIKGAQVEYFGLAVLKAYYAKLFENNELIGNKGIYSNSYYNAIPTRNIEIPLERPGQNRVLINYLQADENDKYLNIFERYSFIDVYNNKIPDLTDKMVLIGATAEGLKDVFFTPVGKINGVYIHTNFINTILTKNYLIYFNKFLELALIFFLILLAVYLNLRTGGTYLFLSNLGIIVIFLLIYPIIIFTPLVLNYPIESILSAVLAIVVTNIIKYITEDKKKTKLMQALSEYVSKDIAQKVLETTGSVNLEGEKKEITIFFSDIEGFTTISENLSPESLVHFLRYYLGEMSDVILDEKGFINKYEGDAIMALWGVFGEIENHSTLGCIAALKQKVKLKSLNQKFMAEGYGEIRVRMGLHKGEAIIGNIGSEGRKMEFTALGDSVNLASRLEGVNKNYGTEICVSDDIFVENKDKFEFRYLDKIRVKGKNKAVHIYELLNVKGNLSQEKNQIMIDFRRAMDLYYARKFDEARKLFQTLVELGDKPSKVYVDRCDKYIETPPLEDWDFIWTYDTK
ncbi:MAG: adenylate/guanylate cyclase domain-containing protein [Candidatus Gracilibacteria bacterium]|nr:adenylate/guanylate cyclase domain-containing protein [Candidatus Gracilibacteria bacterium]